LIFKLRAGDTAFQPTGQAHLCTDGRTVIDDISDTSRMDIL